MKLTNELRTRIIGLYPKSPILINEPGITPVSHYVEGVDYNGPWVITERVNYDPGWIQLILTPLSEITDEDAIWVAGKCGIEVKNDLPDGVLCSASMTMKSIRKTVSDWGYTANCGVIIADYLRSKGYMVPYMGIDLYEAGIAVKLTTPEKTNEV